MAGLFIGWTRPVRGREQAAARVFGEFMQHLDELVSRGDAASVEPVLLQAHGGDLGGFVLVRGDREKLDAAARTDAFRRLVARAGYVVDGFGVVNCLVGAEEVQRAIGSGQDAVADLRA